MTRDDGRRPTQETDALRLRFPDVPARELAVRGMVGPIVQAHRRPTPTRTKEPPPR